MIPHETYYVNRVSASRLGPRDLLTPCLRLDIVENDGSPRETAIGFASAVRVLERRRWTLIFGRGRPVAMRWTDDLATGVDEIDSQHKELFNRVNALLSAMSEGRGKEHLHTVVRFLEDYVVTHFSTEEGYMARHSYPGMTAHKAEHADFVRDFGNLKRDFETQGASSALAIQVQRRVCDWLVHHIGQSDKAFGAHLRTRAAGTGTT